MDIATPDSARLKLVKALLRSKEARHQHGLFVAEGRKLVLDIIKRGHTVEWLLFSRGFARDRSQLEACLAGCRYKAYGLADSQMEKISSLRTDPGVLAVIRKREWGDDWLKSRGRTVLVACEELQDPGNLGTIIRSCTALGAGGLILTGDSVEVYSPKVVRASSGYLLDLPVVYMGKEGLRGLRQEYCFWLCQTPSKAGVSIMKINQIPEKIVFVFGNEGRGISSLKDLGTMSFYIPMGRGVNSLNVAVAVSISLFAVATLCVSSRRPRSDTSPCTLS